MLGKFFKRVFGKSHRERKEQERQQFLTAESLLEAIPLQDPAALAPVVIKLWPTMDEEIRKQMRQQAQDYGWEAYFITDLEDAEPEKRLGAIEILGLIGSKQSVWPLLNALASKNEIICFTAAKALKELQAPGLIETLIDVLAAPERWPPARVAEIIMARGRDGVMPLLERLPVAPAASRAYIIEILGELGDIRAIPYLINVIEDEDPTIRAKGASALAKLNGPVTKVTGSLLRALADESWEVRAQAALAAGNIGLQEAAPALEALLVEDPDWRVKANARKAIEQLSVAGHEPSA